MKARSVLACVAFTLTLGVIARAERFATFPESKELPSPDGKYVIRSVDHRAAPSDFVGMFYSLILEERATGRTRKLCDYVRRVAVAWSAADLIIVTDYVSKKSARAMVFAADQSIEPIVIDQRCLARSVSDSQKLHLEEDDHVYVEASKVEGDILILRVWGYGARDRGGFRFLCDYNLDQGRASCREVDERSRQR